MIGCTCDLPQLLAISRLQGDKGEAGFLPSWLGSLESQHLQLALCGFYFIFFVLFVWQFVSCVSEVKLFPFVHFFFFLFPTNFKWVFFGVFFLKGFESKSFVLTELVGGCGEFFHATFLEPEGSHFPFPLSPVQCFYFPKQLLTPTMQIHFYPYLKG